MALVVDGQRFRAHRVILAARSDYFRALLYGGMKESQLSEIELMDTSLAAFKHLLRYIYTGQVGTEEQDNHRIIISNSIQYIHMRGLILLRFTKTKPRFFCR